MRMHGLHGESKLHLNHNNNWTATKGTFMGLGSKPPDQGSRILHLSLKLLAPHPKFGFGAKNAVLRAAASLSLADICFYPVP